MDMVEKVAAALFNLEHDGAFGNKASTRMLFGRHRVTYDEIAQGVRDGVYDDLALGNVHKLARVVIEAMREPTEAMKDAGEDVVSEPFVGGRLTNPSKVWESMIDAALEVAEASDPESKLA